MMLMILLWFSFPLRTPIISVEDIALRGKTRADQSVMNLTSGFDHWVYLNSLPLKICVCFVLSN